MYIYTFYRSGIPADPGSIQGAKFFCRLTGGFGAFLKIDIDDKLQNISPLLNAETTAPDVDTAVSVLLGITSPKVKQIPSPNAEALVRVWADGGYERSVFYDIDARRPVVTGTALVSGS